ncbi:hypothetical protein I5Q34_32020 [Streptomyces sp. AV19]|uniref:hypothetical protein n=1 Tax=Streptomyces sp. AV19 TaxID=2793068 RepID=UPI0018FE0484|nr:hypothetical protein [Streptomyces sp. AV19]MBH1938834.1 hypothetical protein [Streptomyces sp. AV19]MDG4534767.1 hypothetical protein [Streptomyces sp. AV19]
MSSPGLYLTHLVAPKHGSTAAECEDAVRVLPDVPCDVLVTGPMTASVCDGATESVLAKDWARLLAAASAEYALRDEEFFTGGAGYERFATEVVERWEPWLEEYTRNRAAAGRPLKWYEQAKLAEGAYATMLTLRITPEPGSPTESWHWQAAALGDSCLFHMRDDKPLRSFPVEHPEEFGTAPDLFGSRNRDTGLIAARTRFTRGVCEPGDRLLLMSDALASWFLTASDPVHALRQLLEFGGPHDADSFGAWLETLRSRESLRNDDVAVVRVDIEGK